ncbi:MAG: prolipoprotein diacylglyceryl transferase [Chloroflexi bacterium]|nr:prolipoprotein diacylglyceryl transferase [Chloroflexota bacterium]
MFPTLNIGGLVFPTAGLVIILGAWLSLSLVERSADRLKQNRELMYGVAATAVFIGFAGARLTFVLQFWSAFSSNLLSIIWPLNTGYNVWGGVVVGLVSAFFYGRAKRLHPLHTLDVLVPGVILGFMVVGLADLLGGPGFGSLTAVPWGIAQYGVRRHPVQLYELLVGGCALFTWWRVTQQASNNAGRPFLFTIAVYSAGRLFVDAFRDNVPVIGDGYHILQIASLLILLSALFLISRSLDDVQA